MINNFTLLINNDWLNDLLKIFVNNHNDFVVLSILTIVFCIITKSLKMMVLAILNFIYMFIIGINFEVIKGNINNIHVYQYAMYFIVYFLQYSLIYINLYVFNKQLNNPFYDEKY